MRSVAVLGATGSIGVQALDVIARSPDLEVVALSAHRDVEGLVAAARATGVRHVALVDPSAADRAARELDGVVVLCGEGGVEDVIAASGADLVLNAIVGAAGLRATLAAFAAGADVALANKESLVAGGELVLAAAHTSGRRLLPVDSEHSALTQCLEGAEPGAVTGLVITASGGPFRGRRRDELGGRHRGRRARPPDVEHGPEDHDRLGHPYEQGPRGDRGAPPVRRALRRDRGRRASPVDRARNGPVPRRRAARARGRPRHAGADLVGADPSRIAAPTAVAPLDLSAPLSLDFEPPDLATFRCLALAREAGMAGGTAPCVLNAANEVAVRGFLDGRIGFLDIAARRRGGARAGRRPSPSTSLEQVLDADRRARAAAAGAGAAAA